MFVDMKKAEKELYTNSDIIERISRCKLSYLYYYLNISSYFYAWNSLLDIIRNFSFLVVNFLKSVQSFNNDCIS